MMLFQGCVACWNFTFTGLLYNVFIMFFVQTFVFLNRAQRFQPSRFGLKPSLFGKYFPHPVFT